MLSYGKLALTAFPYHDITMRHGKINSSCWIVLKITKDAFTLRNISWIISSTEDQIHNAATLHSIIHCQCHVCRCPGDLTHWGRVRHICVGKLTIGSDNGLSPGQSQAIIWNNDRLLRTGPLGTNFSEILVKKSHFFFQENASENIVCELAAILSRGRWVEEPGHQQARYPPQKPDIPSPAPEE